MNELYIHRTWEGYKKSYNDVNIAKMHRNAIGLYNIQSKKNQSKASMDKVLLQGEKNISSIENLINALNNTNIKFKGDFKKSNNLEDDINKLSEFVKNINNAIKDFEKVSDITKEISRQKAKGKAGSFDITKPIYKDLNANTALTNLNKSVHSLKKNFSSNGSIEDKAMREIIETMNSIRNDLISEFSEQIFNNSEISFCKEINNMGIDTKTDAVVNKKNDINKNINFSNMGIKIQGKIKNEDGFVELKISDPKVKTTKGNVARVKNELSGKIGDILNKANQLYDESTYHLANTIVHKGSGDSVYAAAKSNLSAIASLEILKQLDGNSPYFIMQENKITILSELTNSIPIDIEISQKDSYIRASKALARDRYIRSRTALKLFLQLKTVFTSKKS